MTKMGTLTSYTQNDVEKVGAHSHLKPFLLLKLPLYRTVQYTFMI